MQRMSFGVLEQHRAVPICGIEVASEHGDGTRALSERAAHCQRWAFRAGLLHIGGGDVHRLLRKSEEPEHAGPEIAGDHALVELKARDARFRRVVVEAALKHTREVKPGILLLA